MVAGPDTVRRWGHYAHSIERWGKITGRAAPELALLNNRNGVRSSLTETGLRTATVI